MWEFCVCLCFVTHYFGNILLLHTEEEERAGCFVIIVLQMCCCNRCSVALPRDAVVWFAVCVCGISWSYSITHLFFGQMFNPTFCRTKYLVMCKVRYKIAWYPASPTLSLVYKETLGTRLGIEQLYYGCLYRTKHETPPQLF